MYVVRNDIFGLCCLFTTFLPGLSSSLFLSLFSLSQVFPSFCNILSYILFPFFCGYISILTRYLIKQDPVQSALAHISGNFLA